MTMRATVAVAGALAVVGMVACGSDDRADVATTTPVITDAATASSSTPAITTAASSEVSTTAPESTVTTTATAAPMQPIFDLTAAGSADGWRVTNDTVMGGVSTGELAWTDGALVFIGELSLANEGGFASVRGPDIDATSASEWARRPGPRLQVDGDGRTWTVEVRTESDSGGWIRTFATSPDGLTDVELQWSAFEPVTQFLEPRPADQPLDPARVVSIAFYLVDGIEGPFQLGIRSIT